MSDTTIDTMSDELVTFERVGKNNAVGIARLTREKPLNSLLLDTIDQLSNHIYSWLADDSVRCIVLDSSSERAFCAGADIAALYHSIIDAGDGPNEYAHAFFTNEYRLNYALHTASKPIVVWGHGIVMGGGLGLLGGCSHRIGTPATKIAMPEITIGLFPDAGGTQFLTSLPDHLGLFAGLTGCQLSAVDSLALGLLDFVVKPEDKTDIFDAIADMEWQPDNTVNAKLLNDLLGSLPEAENASPQLLRFREQITPLMVAALAAEKENGSNGFFNTFEAGLDALPEDEWIHGAMATYRAGSPTTAKLFVEQMKRAEGMSLDQMFQMELVIACQCIRHPDFPEGVRALLIDKDRTPKWQFPTANAVPDAYVAEHFESVWEGAHPLADLS